MSYSKYIALCFAIAILSVNLYGQSKGKSKLTAEETKTFNEAESYFKDGDYSDALPNYENLLQSHPDATYFMLRAGICHLYEAEDKEKSVEYLEQVLKEEPKTTDIDLYLGRAYHSNERFDDAIRVLTKYLDKKPNEAKRLQVEGLLENCENAKIIIQMPVGVKIQNVGAPINSKNHEYVPVISSDESVLIYTYKGESSKGGLIDYDGSSSIFGDYYEDVFISYKVGNSWLSPESIGDNINTIGHDACVALSSDGQKLFVFKSTVENGGDIYMSKLEGDVWGSPEKLSGDVNSNYWEGSASLSSDGRALYFSSERPLGKGGRDIYKAILQPDGSWGNVSNLGAAINTKADDDAPFIHPDGKLLFFSSKGHKSIGGFDIFQSDLQEDSTWSEPTNLGYPINTTNDDIYYVVSADGKRGYYSSSKSGGFGKQDIYMIEPAMVNKRIALAMIRGIITLDHKPVKANIMVTNTDNNQFVGDYNSNAATGKYLINVPTGNNYKLVYKVEGVNDQEKIINTSKIDSFMNATLGMMFYTKDFLEKLKADSLKIQDSSKADIKTLVDTVQSASSPGELSYDEMLQKYGEQSFDSLYFKVQIGAFELDQNFNYSALAKIGEVQRQKHKDGITRFTIGGSFKTLNEADVVLKLVKASGINDAFIVCMYKDQRIPVKSFIATIPKNTK